MKCKACGYEDRNPVSVAGGRVGGKARVAKGFSDARVRAKALAVRRSRRMAK